MKEISASLVRVGGARLPTFTISAITYKVVVYALAERADTLPVFLLYPYIHSVEYGVQAVLESCGLTRPDVGEQYWRLPAEISVQALQVKSLRYILKSCGSYQASR
jgi:hypothetical protein